MKKTSVLIADDEVSILKFVGASMRVKGYEVITASDGQDALHKAEENNPGLVILDVTMPKLDGFEVCRRLREWSQVPIIMLSARSEEQDKVKCLDLGADDYITKPFGKDELLARVRAVTRRANRTSGLEKPSSFSNGKLNVNFAQRKVTVFGKGVRLTPTEYNLLQELILNEGKVLTHSHVLKKIWGPEYGNEKVYLHVFIGRLRKKIELDPGNPVFIISVPAVGYKFQNTF